MADRFDGQGTLSDFRSMTCYTGGFRDGQRDGQGEETYGLVDGHFHGNWKDGKRASGTFTHPDGTRWAREYDDDENVLTDRLLGNHKTMLQASSSSFPAPALPCPPPASC